MDWRREEIKKRNEEINQDERCIIQITNLWNKILLYNESLPEQLRLYADKYGKDIMPTIHAPRAFIRIYIKQIFISFHCGRKNINDFFDNNQWVSIHFCNEKDFYYCSINKNNNENYKPLDDFFVISENDFDELFKNICTGILTLDRHLKKIRL